MERSSALSMRCCAVTARGWVCWLQEARGSSELSMVMLRRGADVSARAERMAVGFQRRRIAGTELVKGLEALVLVGGAWA